MSLVLKNHEAFSDWSKPNFDTIIAKSETHFGTKCTELEMLSIGSNHAIAKLSLEAGVRCVARVDYAFQPASVQRARTVSWKLTSEVATMRYIKKNTDIPVPEVYAFDVDSEGTVGGPWMLIEYIPNPTLVSKWPCMSPDQRKLLCSSIANVWSRLLSLRFDGIGSLDIDVDSQVISVGPYAPLASRRSGDIAPPTKGKCGPFESVREWMLALARQDLVHVNQIWPPVPENVEANIQRVLEVILPDEDPIALFAVDLCAYNIFVSDEDPTRITSIIDWEGAKTEPLWNIKRPGFFVSTFHMDKELYDESMVLEKEMWEEVGRLNPTWAEAMEKGKTLRAVVLRARHNLSEEQAKSVLIEE